MPSPVAHLSDLTHPGALYAFPFCCSRFSPHFSPQFLRPSLPTELRTMSVTLESISLSSPNPNPSPTTGSPLRITPYHPSSQSSSSLRFASLLGPRPRPRPHGVSAVARTLSPIGLGHGLVPLTRRTSCNRLVLASAASREDSSKIEVEKENNNVGAGAEASEEEWQKTLASLKEQALKMQSVSQEVYEIYSERAKVILIETSKQLKAQADKASQDLNELAKVIGEDGKEYLSLAAENSPVPLKDVVETFTSPSDDLDKISKVRDFYLGIPYGVALSVGGLLSFMLTGSIPAVRFGVILGGALLALSISSLRAWKKGESLALALKGQTAIAGIIFLREICLLSQKPSFSTRLATIISGAMVAFYLYRIMLDGDLIKGSNGEDGKEN